MFNLNILSIVIILFFYTVSFSSFAKEVAVLFAAGELPPFSSQYLDNYGMVSELITATCKEEKLSPTFQFYPWLRVENLVEMGKVFAGFPYVYTKERAEKYIYSDIIYFAQEHLFYFSKSGKNKIEFNFEKMDDLKKYRVGFIRGYYVKNQFDKLKIPYEESNSYESLIEKLMKERVDLIIDNDDVLNYKIKKIFKDDSLMIKNFKRIDFTFSKKFPKYLIVSKKYQNSDKILVKFNNGLNKIKKNGIYNNIISKYSYDFK